MTETYAVAKYDFHKKVASWDHREDIPVLRGYFGAGFLDGSLRYLNARVYVSDMNNCEYTAGQHWQIIPFTEEALAKFAKSCER